MNDACIHDQFPTSFTDEVLENICRPETYSFNDGFSGYHQIKIVLGNRSKTTFAIEWGSFQYTIIPFGLKIIVLFSQGWLTFKEFINEFLEVYFDDWIVFGMVKKHVSSLRLMLDTCRKYHISLNLNKCIFCVP